MFSDFQQIKAEIERETDRITGENKGISNKPINLKIYSPHVLNLTLVDLPGMTRIPVGAQPRDIEHQIRAMILQFISNPNAIILSVTAANTDIANSDGIKLAQEVDPEGNRTIGVVTKLDIMDKGTDAYDVLTGQVIPLRLGFVGVINRSQQDINSKKSIRDAVKDEQEFFSRHPQYRSIASQCGTPYLTRLLNRVLLDHIRNCLPELKTKIAKLLSDAQREMDSYGTVFDDNKGSMLLQIITKFSQEYCNAIDGRLSDLGINELFGGARINYIFTEVFAKCLKYISPDDGLTMNDIRTAIQNATGPRASLFVPEVSFEVLVRRQITRLEEPSLQCVELVYDELQRVVSSLESSELQRFQTLREKVMQVVSRMLQNLKIPTRKMINNLIAIEHSYINTNHKDFVGGEGAIAKMFERIARNNAEEARSQQPAPGAAPGGRPPQGGQQPGQQGFFGQYFNEQPNQNRGFGAPPAQGGFGRAAKAEKLAAVPMSIKASVPTNKKEKFETEIIQNLLSSYFDIVRKNVGDSVPKSIMFFLVNTSKDTIQNELVRCLYKEDLFDELLEENPLIASKRKACKEMLDVLKQANEVLMEVREFNPTHLAV
jgi:dynamin 1-like protein